MFEEHLIEPDLDLEMDYPHYDCYVHYRKNFRFRMWTQLAPLNVIVYELRSPFHIYPTTLLVTGWKDHSMLFRMLDCPPQDSHLHRIEERPFVHSIKKLLETPVEYLPTPHAVYQMRGVDLIGRFWLLHCFSKVPALTTFEIGR